MSWAAHELESYLLHKHIRTRVSFLAILTGCLAPDMLTKLPVYGIELGNLVIRPENPWEYHRGWPGAGFTHSLLFAAVLGLLVLWIFRSREWALGLAVGTAAHVLTDIFDSVGTMLFFPFTTQQYSTGMWAYAAQAGRYGDAAAYYGSLGLVWDLFWLTLALLGFRALRARYFFEEVVPSDPAWGWFRRRLRLSDRVLLALYRAYFVYGACRVVGWTAWVHLIEGAPMDWTWGGPYWVEKATLEPTPLPELVTGTAIGLAGLATALWLLWLLLGRRLWAAAAPEPREPARLAA
ncbi:metal-dependent hydrolase [Streptomyces hainanensis]|uniref:Metal-dependent hydrolase n=1 Tax=Streptomyces hainanensis TaxID=402648 RepID=A0A4R4TRU9_9ACTN|nr:metal-dependent hydrolase [Streptomyces hainanensis]TDC78734.1 metal-dependent hydrolase [Streptomyces hainanensis]